MAFPTALLANSCTSTTPNRDPTGEVFPRVTGTSLEHGPIELPTAYAGEPVVLLVGYRQRTQFDIDRWFMGLIQAEVAAPVVEVPTIPGLVASFAYAWIDNGMRSGIPKEACATVITACGKNAQPITELTGNENSRLTRVLVLDAEGRVVYFDDRGYFPQKALVIAELPPPPTHGVTAE